MTLADIKTPNTDLQTVKIEQVTSHDAAERFYLEMWGTGGSYYLTCLKNCVRGAQ